MNYKLYRLAIELTDTHTQLCPCSRTNCAHHHKYTQLTYFLLVLEQRYIPHTVKHDTSTHTHTHILTCKTFLVPGLSVVILMEPPRLGETHQVHNQPRVCFPHERVVRQLYLQKYRLSLSVPPRAPRSCVGTTIGRRCREKEAISRTPLHLETCQFIAGRPRSTIYKLYTGKTKCLRQEIKSKNSNSSCFAYVTTETHPYMCNGCCPAHFLCRSYPVNKL